MRTINESSVTTHPCFSKTAAAAYSRIHLPVAPGCNIQCAYCDRKTDCPNESRPGVSSTVLNPEQAEFYARRMLDADPSISVIGIAGPGDAFNDPVRTIETLRRIRGFDENVGLCISTNGLAAGRWIETISGMGLTHLTVTVNAVDPLVGSRIYQWVRFGKRRYSGAEGARIILEQQKEAVIAASDAGIAVKMNTILVPGINDFHIPEIASEAAGWGAALHNIIPLIPVAGTPFATVPPPDPGTVSKYRLLAGKFLPQMTHCGRCRADAAGKIGDQKSGNLGRNLLEAASHYRPGTEKAARFAVGTREGMLVNLHLGEAPAFAIYEATGEGLIHTEDRKAPSPGKNRWQELCTTIEDCDAAFVSGAGETALRIMSEKGITVEIAEGIIEHIIMEYRSTGNLSSYAPYSGSVCMSACGGNGSGCL